MMLPLEWLLGEERQRWWPFIANLTLTPPRKSYDSAIADRVHSSACIDSLSLRSQLIN